jgi:hypothetical protein
MRLSISSFAPALLVLVIASSQAMACSCARDPTAEGILDSASAVFTGTAEENLPVGSGGSVTTFRVTESFKGPPRGTIVRVKHRDGPSPSCGVTFSPGEVYTLAAYQTDNAGVLSTSFCSTWMFLPHVGLSRPLIERMREMRPRP